MKTHFNIGTYQFHDEPNMNYQLQRSYSNGGDLEEIKAAAAKIKTIEDCIREFSLLGDKALAENNKLRAVAYYRMANFYLAQNNPDKQATYEKVVALVHEMYKDVFTSETIKVKKVPYADGYLPVWHVEPKNKSEKKNVVVMHLGFDAIKEDLVPILIAFHEADLELYLFEGPGQGETLYKYKLPMMHEYEKPVGAVLDHFNLKDVTLIGLSLGAYLAPRAAAYEKRISRVISWGVLYDFFNVVTSRRGKFLENFLKAMLAIRASFIVNAAIRLKMKRDTYTRWGVEHGMSVFDAKTPYEYFKKIQLYSTKNISHLVDQDYLIMSSTHCHFIPEKQLAQQIEKLKNVKSLTVRIFTKYEKAENHVSFGNIPLVLEQMINWIKEHTADSIK